MSPRADYECRKCEATYEDLPLNSVRCPVCGFKRGFRRLYNRVNVSTAGHAVALGIDKPLGTQLNEHSMNQDAKKAYEREWAGERAKAYELGSPEQRAAIATETPATPVQWKGAKAAFAGVGPEARAGSAWPFVKRSVVPRPA
jgi:DNA-directed RNA polymerase subunit RPC12/RpoP